jgi:hypothetical protein
MSRVFLPAVAAFALALAACATPADSATPAPPPTEPPPPPLPPAPPQAACKPEPAQRYVGQVATADVVEQARVAAGAQIARTLKPGQVVTMEYHSSRLNLDVNEGNVITGARCG